ncbi:manganese efflux pump MntP family protein [Pseudalkalibacillus berkeleyi]|uniref:Putative manganese efflux pump MntP n=1 Tax=Pseudalkalibacillus berkeleyi TaxID=1069813 RepID=A0ABS9H1P8_9BACL|nr:manganese efflux pump MntP family protein [Pseudalkalibacillus berkeleyi]MCF6138913.1 manganese efflux pump MntP family protein [Pseudalkalibacillus berkeleyi]
MDLSIVGELLTLTIMAIALGMDAFSMGLGMGMITLRLRQIMKISILIGVFHMVMPLLGMTVGKQLTLHFGNVATLVGGILLILLGFQMIYSSFRSSDEPFISPKGTGVWLFSISVSLDSFSVGLSLGIFGAKIIITILLFGIISMIMTWFGLMIGRKTQKWFGSYGEALGGCILLSFGLKLLW